MADVRLYVDNDIYEAHGEIMINSDLIPTSPYVQLLNHDLVTT